MRLGRGHAVGLYTRLLTRNHLDADPPASRLSAGRCIPEPAPDAQSRTFLPMPFDDCHAGLSPGDRPFCGLAMPARLISARES